MQAASCHPMHDAELVAASAAHIKSKDPRAHSNSRIHDTHIPDPPAEIIITQAMPLCAEAEASH